MIKSRFTIIISGTECMEANTDFIGNDLRKVPNIPSANACACECRSEAGCSVFTWGEISRDCFLKTSDKGRNPYEGAYSGRADCCEGNR